MSFLKRLYFFLFGLSIGIIILIFITNKKGGDGSVREYIDYIIS